MRRRWLGRPVGSSPHTRGTRYCTNNECETFRFIPAYAGNDPSVPRELWPPPVHPRIRGERFLRPLLRQRDHGSSPHTRGTPHPDAKCRPPLRFIPAYAGNATTRLPVSRPRSVHPRIRGERQFVMTPVSTSIGSSPHTRGTRIRGANLDPHRRFIPACAGNAAVRAPRARRHPVHPRMRGERKLEFALISVITGSSPHARGTLIGEDGMPEVIRFIPACAGNAHSVPPPPWRLAVHPRMRGERVIRARQTTGWSGSSPHARGTLLDDYRKYLNKRFIPACAGNALMPVAAVEALSVHPRMRGERGETGQEQACLCGSSPHARGTHFQ